MLTIKRVLSGDGLSLPLAAGEMACAARADDGALLGFVVFRMSDDLSAVLLLRLWTRDDDFGVADGLVRSAAAGARAVARELRITGVDAALTDYAAHSGLFRAGRVEIANFFGTCC
ncbi:MAG: hypothetical protein VB092_01710 [Oscillospiraceae bacterium]|nr:hypothetical protein [Oscillospiraceae bacterium]